jgi:hypothetical protein
MPSPEVDKLGRRLFRIDKHIFTGGTQADFIEHVFKRPALRSKIRLFLNSSGDMVGYCGMHTFEREVRGRRVLVIRGETGLLPEYRGRGAAYSFGMVYAFWEKICHPSTSVYFLGTLVHTSSYHLFYKYFPIMYPHPVKGFPEPERALAIELINSFPEPPVTASNPLIREACWRTIETEQERQLNLESHRPDVRLFVELNPGYPMGHGLVIIAPISFRNIVAALLRRFREVLLAGLGMRVPRL